MIRRTLTLWLALNALAFVFAGQEWWQLSINTGDHLTSITGTGIDADKSISAILMFSLAALLFVAFSRGWPAIAISSLAAAATGFLAFSTFSHLVSGYIGGITAAVEKQTGIAIDAYLPEATADQVTGELQVWAWLMLATLVALLVVQVIFAVRYRTWAKALKPRSDRTKRTQAKVQTDDTISLWDSQRE